VGCPLRDRTSVRQAGSMSAAPTRKHTAPSKVPALSSRRSSTVPVLGTTKPAIADTMKATEPSMLSHAIHHGKSRDRGRPDRIYVRGDRTQGEAGRAEHEKPGDGGVQASRFCAHANRAAGTRVAVRRSSSL
jgi:hypothetical protein